jgi:hypothetical protein
VPVEELREARRALVGLSGMAPRPLARPPPPPPSRTKWTRRVPHPVLIGHAASLTPYYSLERDVGDTRNVELNSNFLPAPAAPGSPSLPTRRANAVRAQSRSAPRAQLQRGADSSARASSGGSPGGHAAACRGYGVLECSFECSFADAQRRAARPLPVEPDARRGDAARARATRRRRLRRLGARARQVDQGGATQVCAPARRVRLVRGEGRGVST